MMLNARIDQGEYVTHLSQAPLPLTGRADLHMHTTTSDGTASAVEMLDYAARRLDLDVVCITDHDRLEASLWACTQNGRYPFEIIPGVEVSTRDGHVLALWVTRPIPRDLSLEETTAAIHEAGGMAILAHPFEILIAHHTFWRYLTHPAGLKESGIDAVEIHNAGAFTPGGSWLARRVYQNGELPVVGNSDAHMPELIGTGITWFKGSTASDLRDSLRTGSTAAEGVKWGLTDYLKIFRTSRRMKQAASLGMPSPSTLPTPTSNSPRLNVSP